MTTRVQPSRLVLLGQPVRHSLSPLFQNAALAHAGLPQRYEAIDVSPDTLPELLRTLADENVAGNVTIPHKEQVAGLAHRLTDIASQVGAVNTFWFERGELVGHNTDVDGAASAISALGLHDMRARRCAMLGAGGSASAVLFALQRLGCEGVRLWSRSVARSEALASRAPLPVSVYEQIADAVRDADLVVNATPIGLQDDEMPLDVRQLRASAAVLDLVYRPGETAWVHAARARGLVAEDGLRMLVEQGAAAFASWFGVEPSRDAMWAVLPQRTARA